MSHISEDSDIEIQTEENEHTGIQVKTGKTPK